MRRGMRTTASVLAAMVLLVAGCGDDDEAADSGSTSSTAPAPGSSSSSSAPPTSEGDEAPGPGAGTHFGYVVSVDLETQGGPYLEFDEATLYTGDDAARAQVDGVPGCEEVVDYCISNDDDSVQLLTVAVDVEVLDVDYSACCEAKPSTLEAFAADRNPPRTPVDLTVEGGLVTAISELYFP